MEDGGFEIEIALDEAPASNVFDFQIERAADLDFFYQPELTAEEIAEGAVRPENVVDSCAVHHKTKANHRVKRHELRDGKASACHVVGSTSVAGERSRARIGKEKVVSRRLLRAVGYAGSSNQAQGAPAAKGVRIYGKLS